MSHHATLTQISAPSDPVHADGSISEYAAIRHGNLAFKISLLVTWEDVCHLELFASICQETVGRSPEGHDFNF